MVQYTLAQSPETIFNVSGKDSAKARERAMDQLMELMDAGTLPTELGDGFSPQQFIEVKEPTSTHTSDDDAITQAVQVLSNLATLKLKLQESRTEALQVRAKIDVLFTDEPVSEDEIASLKDGFKVLKTYAQANLRYRDARVQAEEARTVLDRALNSSESKPEPEPKAAKPDVAEPEPKSEPKAAKPDMVEPEPKSEPKPEPKPESKPTAKKS